MTLSAIQKNFSYIFNGIKPMGGGVPKLDMITLNGGSFALGGIQIQPVEIIHGTMTILAYKVNNSAYVTDCSGLPDKAKEVLSGLDVLVLNALGFEPHATHFCLSESLEAIAELKPKRAILTHINHKFDHETVNKDLPENVELAYDGLLVNL
jgi:phosphoribosyl 1,2-cyclic phosphate phosphodiesterase